MGHLHRLACVGLLIGGLSSHAYAQAVDIGDDLPSRMPDGASFDPDRATDPDRIVEGAGVKVGEDTTLHPVLGVETGAISNVFYTNNTNCGPNANCVAPAGFIRLLAQAGVGSLTDARLTPSDQEPVDEVTGQPRTAVRNPGAFQYRADLNAAYDAMLSGNSTVSSTGGLSVGATVRGVVQPVGPVSFWMLNDYERMIRAANFETDVNTDRDINNLDLRLAYHSEHSSIGGFAYYSNTIDVFERAEQEFPDRMLNVVGLHPIWRWLPQTQVYADVSQGYDTGLGAASTKATSYPTAGSLGIASLLTPMITLNGAIGYTLLNYETGPSTSGLTGSLALGYRFSEFGRVTVQYLRAYEDSINANFYQEHVIRAWAYYRKVPFVFSVQPEIHFRDYVGTVVPSVTGSTTRSDTIYQVIAGVSYSVRNSMAIALDYRFTDVSTDFRYMTDGTIIDPSYARHSVLLGFRLAL